MSADRINELKKQRFQFMHELYLTVDGKESSIINLATVGSKMGLNSSESIQIATYLKGENLLKFVTVGGGISITHWGVKEVEQAISEPNEPTEHFLPVNIINIQNMNNSQIQQGTTSSTQTQVIEQSKISEIREILQKISDSLERLELEHSKKDDLQIEIDTINMQLKSSNPKRNVISQCFDSIKNILTSASSSALASQLIELLSQIKF